MIIIPSNRSKPVLAAMLVALVGAVGCDEELEHPQTTLLRTVNDPDGGMVYEHVVNGVKVGLRLLPPQYVAARATDSDALTPEKPGYASSATFIMTIDSETSDAPVVARGVNGPDELRARVEQLSFEMSEYLSLKTGDSLIRPALVNLEPDFGIVSRVHLNVVFPVTWSALLERERPFSVSFVDPTFGTGVHEFPFQPATIRRHVQAQL